MRYICGRSRYYWDTIAKITKYCCNTFADIFAERIKYDWDILGQGVDITEMLLRIYLNIDAIQLQILLNFSEIHLEG